MIASEGGDNVTALIYSQSDRRSNVLTMRRLYKKILKKARHGLGTVHSKRRGGRGTGMLNLFSEVAALPAHPGWVFDDGERWLLAHATNARGPLLSGPRLACSDPSPRPAFGSTPPPPRVLS